MPEGRGRLVLVGVTVLVVLYLIGLAGGDDDDARVGGAVELPATTVVTTTTLGPPTSVVATRAPFSLPAPASRLAAVADASGGVVLAGGRNAQRAPLTQVLRVDPVSGVFGAPAALAEAVQKGAAVAGPSGLVLVGGSGADKPVGAAQNLVAPKATVAGRLPEPRADLTAASIGSTIYVVGGFDGGREPATILASDDGAKTFRVVGSLLSGNRNGTLVAAGGALYLIGGEENGKQVAKVLRIDPTDGASAQVALLPAPLSQAAAFVLDRSLFVAGGRQGANPTDQILRIDLDAGVVTLAGQLPEPVAHPAVAVVGESAWLFGGETGAPSASVVEIRAAR